MNERKDWKESSLPSLLKFMKSGGTPSTSRSDFYGGEIPFVSIEDMTSCSKYLSSTEKTITALGLKNSNTWLVPKEAILYSIYATLGIPRINIIPVTTNQAILALICDLQKVNNNFLFYWLDYIRESIVNINSSQTTQKNLSATIVKTFSVYHPTNIKEQVKIAEVLSTVDKAISETEALIAKQQRIKTGLMQDLLTWGIDENGNLRSEETHQFKDSPLGRIPVEWDVERCISLCTEIIVGIVIRPAQYYREDGTIPILRSANVKINLIDPNDLVYMSERDSNLLNKSQLRRGDLVTVRTGYPGTTSVISKEFDGCNCIDLVISRPNPKKIRSHYLSIWVNSSHGKRQVLENQGGLAQQHFNVGEMKSLLVNVPTIKEQKIIENILLKQSTVVDELIIEIDKLKSLKTALMQDLLTGKKRVNSLLENNPIS